MHSEGLDATALAAAAPSQGRRSVWWDFTSRPGHHTSNKHYGPAAVRHPLARTLASRLRPIHHIAGKHCRNQNEIEERAMNHYHEKSDRTSKNLSVMKWKEAPVHGG